MKIFINILFLFLFCNLIHAQKDSLALKKETTQIKVKDYNPLSPAKAAFLSAVFPGAGQIYNNRYWWQLPLIYGGLGISIYSYIDANNSYDRYRTAFRRRKAGLPDEFTREDGSLILDETGLERAQEQFNSNRNYSLLSVALIYILQITEASVRAHLLQFDTSKNLSITPITIPDNSFRERPKVGLTIKYSF